MYAYVYCAVHSRSNVHTLQFLSMTMTIVYSQNYDSVWSIVDIHLPHYRQNNEQEL